MSRKEFPKAVKVAAIKRATRDGVIYCEECGGQAKAPEIDHVNADALTGQPTLENARVLCRACHKLKTADDVAKISKAKRREAAHLGVKKAPQKKIETAGFEKAEPQKKASKVEAGSKLESLRSMGMGNIARRFR
jgi:5-methylcytosine-specific restriction protein A